MTPLEREALSDDELIKLWLRSHSLPIPFARALLAASSDELAQAVRRYFECFDSPNLADEFEQAERELRAALRRLDGEKK